MKIYMYIYMYICRPSPPNPPGCLRPSTLTYVLRPGGVRRDGGVAVHSYSHNRISQNECIHES